MSDPQKEYKRLRQFLNPAIKGVRVDAVLQSLATGTGYLVDQVEAVHEQIYISTASERYLDQRLADFNLVRPPTVGLSDDNFRNIGISVINRKQVRDLMNELLLIMFGDEATNATSRSSTLETYSLSDGDTLIVAFDGQEPITITFASGQFEAIASASAEEVADNITRSIRKQGRTGRAFAKDDGMGPYVVLISDTIGPSSSVTVLGGRAQNVLQFDKVRPTTAGISTEWTITQVSAGSLRFTWTNGPNPSLGKVAVGDYVNIFGSAFSLVNQGTFTIEFVKSGTVGNAYFEIENPNGVAETVNQGTLDGMLFFNPFINDLTAKRRYAAVFQTDASILEIFIPATTKIVRRERIGSAHIHDTDVEPIGGYPDTQGPYVFDLSQPFTISSVGTTGTSQFDPDTGRVISVVDSSDFPDSAGYIILGYGTSHQEGPIPYLARPSNTSLLLNPSYRIRNIHPSGTDVALVATRGPVQLAKDGTDYQFYVTGIADGRIYTQDLINSVAATGITVVFHILYPGDEGLGSWLKPTSEKTYVWGE